MEEEEGEDVKEEEEEDEIKETKEKEKDVDIIKLASRQVRQIYIFRLNFIKER